MNLCDKCFSAIEPDAAFCKECGAPIGEGSEQSSDAIVYPELAKANLLRMKGDGDAAEKVCLSILKRFPNNPGAHVLLGDLNADAAKLEAAKQWYEMALELMPDNAGLREKLRGVHLAFEQQHPSIEGLEVPNERKTVAAMATIVVLLVVVAALAFWMGNVRANAARNGLSDIVEPISINQTAPPRTQLPNDNKPEVPSQPNAPTTANLDSSMTAGERAVFAALQKEVPAIAGRLLHISIDTKAAIAIATVAAFVGAAQDAIVIECASVGNAILKQDANLSRARVRFITSQTGEIVFGAAVTTGSLASVGYATGTVEWAKAVLVDPAPVIGQK